MFAKINFRTRVGGLPMPNVCGFGDTLLKFQNHSPKSSLGQGCGCNFAQITELFAEINFRTRVGELPRLSVWRFGANLLKFKKHSPKSTSGQGWGAADAQCLGIWSHFAQIPEAFAKINFRTRVGGLPRPNVWGFGYTLLKSPKCSPKSKDLVTEAHLNECFMKFGNLASIPQTFAKIKLPGWMVGWQPRKSRPSFGLCAKSWPREGSTLTSEISLLGAVLH